MAGQQEPMKEALARIFQDLNIRAFRRQLASIDSVPQFALLGIVAGAVTGVVIVAFRLAIEVPLLLFLPENSDNFEGLPRLLAAVLPLVGSAFLALMVMSVAQDDRRVGIVHVLERLGRFQGHLPSKNLIYQFVAGTVALASGHSGGREGPAVHLGAACSSLLGQALKLPNNSIRVLVGCGTVAAISASFNTPVAGVIFSMEVIIMEYTIAGFIPVILAAVVAALVMMAVYGSAPAFEVPRLGMESFNDLPVLIAEGFAIGVIAAIFVYMIRRIYDVAPSSPAVRMLTAGLVTSLIALMVPQVMGIGYDTVNLSIEGNMTMTLLVAILVFKLIATSTTIAMGVPVGVIGPTLVIGAVAGGLVWVIAVETGMEISNPGLYAVLGMGAMMGAVLQAPLAALMAVMELTQNPSIILPAMLVIVIANITASQLFGVKSVFITQLEMQGIEFRQNPLSQALNRASVASIMSRSFERVPAALPAEDARNLASRAPTWLLVEDDQTPRFILRTEDLVNHVRENPGEEVRLSDIPATRKDVTGILLQATLSEALERLNQRGVQALYVNRISAPLLDSPVGIVTREDIESYYQA